MSCRPRESDAKAGTHADAQTKLRVPFGVNAVWVPACAGTTILGERFEFPRTALRLPGSCSPLLRQRLESGGAEAGHVGGGLELAPGGGVDRDALGAFISHTPPPMLTSGVTQAPSTDVHRGEVADAPGGKYYLHIPPSSNLHIPISQLQKNTS